MTQINCLIVTAIPPEFIAVRQHLKNKKKSIDPKTHIMYNTGDLCLDEHTWHVAIAKTGSGFELAKERTEKAIEYFEPKFVLFVGVAGGIKDAVIGNVVAATEAYSYESMRLSETGTQTRPRMRNIKKVSGKANRLEQSADHVALLCQSGDLEVPYKAKLAVRQKKPHTSMRSMSVG
ncbi:MAG: 5'-methylthioadenosine/S-adenosylhomocysteine nucleosidase [Moorea sp. SIO2I5]|nr:5'-methylthioadenosine/S-adenosylhomocysteine nucleosidase [Moorena sp. SIO2I5]